MGDMVVGLGHGQHSQSRLCTCCAALAIRHWHRITMKDMRLYFPYAATSYDETRLRRIAEQEVARCLDASAESVSRAGRHLTVGWVTALRAMGIPVPKHQDMPEDKIHACVARNRSKRLQMDGVIHHVWCGPLTTVTWMTREGMEIHVVSPPTACAMMAAHCSLGELVVLIDSLLRRCNPDRAMTRKDLEEIASSEFRFHGKGKFVQALALSRMNTDSPMETELRLELRRRRIGRNWLVNCLVRHRPSGRGWHVDLCDPQLGIVIEYQGAHHWNKRQGELDSEKFAVLQRCGCVVIPVTAADMATEEARDMIFETILAVVRSRRRQWRRRRLRVQVEFIPLGDGSGTDMEAECHGVGLWERE